jgi:hypothetical protein
MSERVVLCDARNFGFRHAYAHLNLRTSKGFPTGMLHGGLVGLKKMAEKTFPGAAIVFCWDGKKPTWRHQVPPFLYKANRETKDEPPREVQDAFKQFNLLGQVLHNILKFKYLKVDHVEADDLIGLCVTVLRPKYEVTIVSTDQDFYQLVASGVSVYSPKKEMLYTPDAVEKEFGVKPGKWISYRALTGDSSDNLPGASGLGPVRAREAISLGLNPGLPFSMQAESLKIKYAKFEPEWKIVHYCWLMSRILRDIGGLSGCIEEKYVRRTAQSLVAIAESPYRKPYGDKDYTALLKFLSQYELNEALKDRNFWFSVR